VKPTPLARFAVVGTAVTAVDVGLFVLRLRGGKRSVLDAEVPALVASAGVSWGLHRAVTFRDDPYRRWLSEHDAFTASAVVGGAVDVAVTGALLAVGGRRDTRAALAAKIPAVAVAGATRWALHRRVLFRVVRAAHVPAADRTPPPGDVRVSVVVPAYQEAARIGDAVRRIKDAVPGVEVVVVDDGSTDGTADAAKAAGADVVVVQPSNRGKGSAVRAGVLASTGRTIAFTDADLAYSPDQLLGLVEQVEAGWDVVVGSRHLQGSTAVTPASRLRRLGSDVVNWSTSIVLLGAYRDTQAGLKAFRSDVARAMFARTRIDGFAFDVELFVIAERNGYSVQEVPVRVENRAGSTVKVVRDAARLGRDLFRIRRWAREGRYQSGN
jgi:putative flippase GtrA